MKKKRSSRNICDWSNLLILTMLTIFFPVPKNFQCAQIFHISKKLKIKMEYTEETKKHEGDGFSSGLKMLT